MTATIVEPSAAPPVALGNKHLMDDPDWERVVGALMKPDDCPKAILWICRLAMVIMKICGQRRTLTYDQLMGLVGLPRDLAERTLDQALGYLRLCAADPSTPYSPSRRVDRGWHKLMEHSVIYGQVCQRLGGFIHHHPFDEPGVDYSNKPTATATAAAMQVRGLHVDWDLWSNNGNCNDPCLAPVCDGKHTKGLNATAACENSTCTGGKVVQNATTGDTGPRVAACAGGGAEGGPPRAA